MRLKERHGLRSGQAFSPFSLWTYEQFCPAIRVFGGCLFLQEAARKLGRKQRGGVSRL